MVTAKGRPLIDAQSGKILDAALTNVSQEKITAGALDDCIGSKGALVFHELAVGMAGLV